ncbi:MAG: glycoside hydrolase family 99-like domain-containing protein [Proteobacteria bacterium]|nr:glycoside hydrolase family 99-like domain-containing protein [Pseudomonadota bacterium]
MKLGAYYYPGWHACPIRDAAFPKGWSEWDLLEKAAPRFREHHQPLQPLWNREDEANPAVFAKKIATAQEYGIDFFTFAFYWSRGKQLLQGALDHGFLPAVQQLPFRFALMWANRMPRRVLPVKDPHAALINPQRLVYTDPVDFMAFVKHVGRQYFSHPSYLRLDDAAYLSIFDTTFFLRQMGVDHARSAITEARAWLKREGLGRLHLAAIDPLARDWRLLQSLGFNSITHYVFLPEWKGQWLQDYATAAALRARQWQMYSQESGLPYCPSVSPGWDATPRSSEFGREKPRQYPWWPIITGTTPQLFQLALRRALEYARSNSSPCCHIASWNEWTEGHYLEPDGKFGYGWLEAVKEARSGL